MAPKGKGTLKKLLLTLTLIALIIMAFALLGGGGLLQKAGKKVDTLKGTIEQKAATAEKTAEKIKEAVVPGEKK